MSHQRVLVAMSGGVDSSAVAGLLLEQGHEVIGITLQLYDHGEATGRKGACCAGKDIYDACQVADKLGIPHYVINAEERFRKSVIDDFANSYANGQTPVPCIRCNQTVKFQDMLQLKHDLGMDALATGHYARIVEGPEGRELHQAVDGNRDQSYFLAFTTQDQLNNAMFPLGDMPDKSTVRAQAERFGLSVANKPDSQDICFVPNGSYQDILQKIKPEALVEGDFVDEAGNILGQHQGIARYTVGQGKRLGNLNDSGTKRIVIGIDANNRRVIVGDSKTSVKKMILREVNWLINPTEITCMVKVRSRDSFHPATIIPLDGNRAEVSIEDAVLPAPGQACVFYHGTRVLGAGFIENERIAN